jgi:hypothetical protein
LALLLQAHPQHQLPRLTDSEQVMLHLSCRIARESL